MKKNLVITGLNGETLRLASELESAKQSAMILQDTLLNHELILEQRQGRITLLETELIQLNLKWKQESDFAQNQMNSYEASLRLWTGEKEALEKERSDNLFQIKQMNRALRTSLRHIRSLRSVLEGVSPLPSLGEKNILDLLDGGGYLAMGAEPQNKNKLKDLQLCLANLRKEVKDLNCELCSRSTTPIRTRSSSLSPFNLSGDFTMDSRSTSATPSLSSTPAPPSLSSTPHNSSPHASLPTSSHASLNNSPAHTNKLK